ncbi:hypothetical protein ACFQ88_07860 [Paenibacillus sp. NPDC056579]|uniref:hypothetical protein n=1 Tax=Paenibacillus sp. NPDC056579 TaxID=3345871 RepID=UPI00368F1498
MDNKKQVQAMLTENPDMVFDEVIQITIAGQDIAFWLKFASEWGGVLYFMDDKNTKQFEQGIIGQGEYEFSRRTYRLGLITVTGLYDKLTAWSKQNGSGGDYTYGMDSLECYFIPAYLKDYSGANAVVKKQGEAYIQSIQQALGQQDKLEDKLGRIQELVHEYIANMHQYVK